MLIRGMYESNANHLVNAIRALQAALEQHDSAVSEARSLGRSDWRCLTWLVEDGPRSPTAIQRRLGLTSGSVTALLDRLEKRGFVARRPDPRDRRALSIESLPDAERLVADAHAPLDEVMQKVTLRWGTDRASATGRACLDLVKLVEWAAQRV